MASTPNARLVEIDTSKNAVYEEFFTDDLEIRGGFISPPKTPGLGVELKKDILEQYAVN